MPRIVDYPTVLEKLTAIGLVCNYHNGGAFAFPRSENIHTLSWIGPPDPSIRADVLSLTRSFAAPYASTLSSAATRARLEIGGPVWAMPMSHWAYELEFASRPWLGEALKKIGVDDALLSNRNNAAAVEFAQDESNAFQIFLQELLQYLADSSDFMLAFPESPALCMVHHHQQLWWMTRDAALAKRVADSGNAPT